MINLTKETTNDIVVTLKEKQTLTNPYFLFVFQSEIENQIHAIILTDLSGYTYRFNEFTLTLPTDLDLETEGQYKYWIYEQTSPDNLDPDEADNELERGKMLLAETEPTEFFYTPN